MNTVPRTTIGIFEDVVSFPVETPDFYAIVTIFMENVEGCVRYGYDIKSEPESRTRHVACTMGTFYSMASFHSESAMYADLRDCLSYDHGIRRMESRKILDGVSL